MLVAWPRTLLSFESPDCRDLQVRVIIDSFGGMRLGNRTGRQRCDIDVRGALLLAEGDLRGIIRTCAGRRVLATALHVDSLASLRPHLSLCHFVHGYCAELRRLLFFRFPFFFAAVLF